MKPLAVATVALLVIALIPGLFAKESDSDEYQALELEGVAPSWWTPDVVKAVDGSSARGELFNPLTGESVPVAAPAGGVPVAPDYLFIRPGALFLGESGALCTYNFVYSNFQKIGTAGHCVEGRGETVYIVAAPTVPLVAALGTVASFRNGGVGNDWALINIDPQWSLFVDPNVAYVGGPSCSVWTPALESVKHVGHGIQTGLVASVPRTSLVTAFNGRSFEGVGELSGGDSGSPALEAVGSLPGCAGGGAVGVLTHCASITGIECLPLFWGTDIRVVPATVTPGLDPL